MSGSTKNTSEDSPETQNVHASFAHAKTIGNGLAWTGFGLALLWWASAGYLLYQTTAQEFLGGLSTGLLMAGGGLVLIPGLILVFAGFMARQNKRTHEANLLLLQASGQLLSPARNAIDDMTNLAEATRYSTAAINKTSSEALAALNDVNDAMAAERLRAESVSYAMADNARELTQRLAEERAALEALSHALDAQATLMGDAVPRQARMLTEATQKANEHVASVDLNLEKRIEHLKQASSTLATRLIDLDTVARDAATRTDALQASITRIENTLSQSQRTVETAERASTMAVDAAKQTGKSLQDAVSFALDSAREANREIEESTRRIKASTQSAMQELRKTGMDAASAAARVQEQSTSIAATPLVTVTPREAPMSPPSAPTSAPKAPIHAPAAPLSAPEDTRNTDKFQIDDPLLANRSRKRPTITEVSIKPDEKRASDARRIYQDEIDPIAETRPAVNEDDLFDADMNADIAPLITSPEIPLDTSIEEVRAPVAPDGPRDDKTMELGTSSAPIMLNKAYDSAPHKQGQSADWRDIIADIGKEPKETPVPTFAQSDTGTNQRTDTWTDSFIGDPSVTPREATAEELMYRLQSSGIPLPTAFRSRDKKKIAAAARKDEQARRRAIRSAAGNEVDRVAVRLNKDDQLMDLARQFVYAEKAEALKALEDTGSSGRHASPRLSAYLLVDAALSPSQRPLG